VDEAGGFRQIVKGLATLAREIPLLFPVHPRTRLRLGELGLAGLPPNLFLTEPVGYLDFLALQRHAALVITDSGGIQEETTFLHVPCLTMRENTERPITVTLGTNILVGQDVARMQSEAKEILAKGGKEGTIPPLWDGRASNRIADALGI
jgi:UDP-N-acetylglucosamine 2-epimerase (non-hydrolysing)